MPSLKILPVILSLTLSFVSCKATRTVTNQSVTSDKPGKLPAKIINAAKTGDPAIDYINAYKDIAIYEMKRTGVPASITLAQGMLESDYGRSELAKMGNNHFGIKCYNWNGATVYHHDDRRNDCFRKYGSAEDSFQDHSDFIKNGSRYSSLFNLSPYDYKAWATGLKKAGYATNPKYAALLIQKIEENNLDIYDKRDGLVKTENVTPIAVKNPDEKLAPSTTGNAIVAKPSRINENNRIQYIIVKDGDTKEKIEKDFNLLRWEIARYNELGNDFSLSPGQILYLQPKRDKAEPGKNDYIFREGDTMYQVSQKFGIKLKSLYEMNRLENGTEPQPGTKLWLRSMKPVS